MIRKLIDRIFWIQSPSKMRRKMGAKAVNAFWEGFEEGMNRNNEKL